MQMVDLGLELRVAAAKVSKYAVRESGDSLEMVERPRGGLSFVLADGQTSGRGAKAVSLLVARKVLALLAEGVRDGAAARAAHDNLFTQYHGKVQADLTILSLDLATSTIVVSRNTQCPVVVRDRVGWSLVEGDSVPIGIRPATRPLIHEFPFQLGTYVIVSTDGLWSGGRSSGRWDVLRFIQERFKEDADPQDIAEALLREACALHNERPTDDISVLVLGVMARRGDDPTRRMWVQVPI